jgi:hypothetical protein
MSVLLISIKVTCVVLERARVLLCLEIRMRIVVFVFRRRFLCFKKERIVSLS